MTVITRQFSLDMQGATQIENITEKVKNNLLESELVAGIITLFIKHTTASIMIFEDEAGLRIDTKDIWDKLIPADSQWQHNTRNAGETNSHSHLRAQIQGQSLTIPFTEQALMLGIWQQIVIVDFDTAARTRDIIIQIIGE
ncbi:secondary thiamine-phosphate synthase enzyme YjbQ [Gammaproteobacteria bacterium]|mgnify:FL=1|jgi:secondary thiamine-phosphate synthase enzyme|nr:secondary thiamine-phosphate synthase enzyme YjbQ [Gammaproteobacteria bacterium]